MDALLDLCGGQLAGRLNDRPLAVQPLRLDRVQPRRLDRQPTDADLAAALPLDLAVVRPDPAPYALADVPTGVVPDQHEDLLTLPGETRAQPVEEVLRHLADRSALHETQQHRPAVRPQQSVAGQSLLAAAAFVGQEPQRLVAG